MAPNRRKVVASRHLVCGNCRSWIQFESSGCGRTWAETRGESFAFTCKGCTEVTALEKWHQEKVEDFCGRLYSSEDRYKIEQGG